MEELNLRWVRAVRAGASRSRRNRIRSTEGLQTVPSLQKLYMSNNEIQVRINMVMGFKV